MKTARLMFLSIFLCSTAEAALFNNALTQSIRTGNAVVNVGVKCGPSVPGCAEGQMLNWQFTGTTEIKFGTSAIDLLGNTKVGIELLTLDVSGIAGFGQMWHIVERFGGSDPITIIDPPCEVSGGGCSRGNMVFQPGQGGNYQLNFETFIQGIPNSTGQVLIENNEPIALLGTLDGDTISLSWAKVPFTPVEQLGVELDSLSVSITLPLQVQTGFVEARSLNIELASQIEELTDDQDGDGVPNEYDQCPGSSGDVDLLGCSQEQFCGNIVIVTSRDRRICRRSDWKNDEPLMSGGQDRDCTYTRQGSQYICEPF